MPTKAKRYCKLCGNIATKGAYCEEHAPRRDYAEDYKRREPYRAWYSLAVWERLKEQHLEQEPLCRECVKQGIFTPSDAPMDVDHITPHRGDWELFTDPENLQTLCHKHHSQKTLREQAQRRRG